MVKFCSVGKSQKSAHFITVKRVVCFADGAGDYDASPKALDEGTKATILSTINTYQAGKQCQYLPSR